jgi:hypothetical protein
VIPIYKYVSENFASLFVAMRVRGEFYPSPADSLPKNQQLAAKPQSYLTSYRYIGFQRSISDQK